MEGDMSPGATAAIIVALFFVFHYLLNENAEKAFVYTLIFIAVSFSLFLLYLAVNALYFFP